MSVIMKRTFVVPNTGKAETVEPIEYIDSIVESSYINAINTSVMREVRELNFEDEVYGSSDVRPLLIDSEKELASQEDGFWVIDTSVRDPRQNILKHSLTLYQKIKYPGRIWNSYETRKICEFYNVKCKRTVPRIVKKPTRFQQFEFELADAVKGFKSNAERTIVLVNETE